MKFKKIALIVKFLLILFSYNALSQSEGPKKIADFEKWSVYAKTKNLCYMIAEPEQSEGDYKVRGRVRIVVYRNNVENQDKNALGIDFGYTFRKSKASIEIDNKKKFKLSTFGQTAWTGSKTKADKKIINAMIKGKTLVALGKSKRGTLTKDTYSLEGFAKAFEK